MSIQATLKNFLKHRFTTPIAAGPLKAKEYGLSHPTDGCYWLLADPVTLEPDHQRVFMRGYTALALDKQKDELLIKNLNELLHQDALELIYLTPMQWIVKCKPGSPIMPHITTYSSLECLNQDISTLLPTGKNNGYWRRLFTECQMIMQNYENNSLWFWGSGVSQ